MKNPVLTAIVVSLIAFCFHPNSIIAQENEYLTSNTIIVFGTDNDFDKAFDEAGGYLAQLFEEVMAVYDSESVYEIDDLLFSDWYDASTDQWTVELELKFAVTSNQQITVVALGTIATIGTNAHPQFATIARKLTPKK